MSRPNRLPALLLLLAALRTCAPAHADEPKDAPPADADAVLPSEPVFAALKTDGTTVSGQVRQLGPGGKLVLEADGKSQLILLADLVKLTRGDLVPTIPPDGPQVLFPDGDRLCARVALSGEESLEVVPDAFEDAETSIPLGTPLGALLRPPADPTALESLLDRVRDEPRDGDVLWLANGDRLVGSLLELTPQAVKFQREGAALSLDLSTVRAIGFDPRLARYPKPEGPFLELTLGDGSRLGLSEFRKEGGALRGKARFGAPVRVPLAKVARAHVRGGSVVYLTERNELAVQYEGYVAPPPPFRRDASVAGRPLRLAGRPYDRGLGMQSRTLLAYKLEPGDRRFQASVGLDDRAGPLGSVVFRVRVDNEARDRFTSPPLSARDEPRAIDVDVSGAKLLILMTEFGQRGEVRDYADWVEARLIR